MSQDITIAYHQLAFCWKTKPASFVYQSNFLGLAVKRSAVRNGRFSRLFILIRLISAQWLSLRDSLIPVEYWLYFETAIDMFINVKHLYEWMWNVFRTLAAPIKYCSLIKKKTERLCKNDNKAYFYSLSLRHVLSSPQFITANGVRECLGPGTSVIFTWDVHVNAELFG